MYDKNLIIQTKNRIAKNYDNFNFLKEYSSEIINKKIKSLSIDFPRVLEIGSHAGELTEEFELNISSLLPDSKF